MVVMHSAQLAKPSAVLNTMSMKGRLEVTGTAFPRWCGPSFPKQGLGPLASALHLKIPFVGKVGFGLLFFGTPQLFVLVSGRPSREIQRLVKWRDGCPWDWLWHGPQVPMCKGPINLKEGTQD